MSVGPQVRQEQDTVTVVATVVSRHASALYWIVLLATVLAASVYVAWCMPQRGWVPHDDGALGESAVRVLHGELPHRDFAEVYTGGLAYLDAAAFRLFGANTMTTRWVLFVFIVPSIVAMFYVLTRFLPPLTAGACTLVAVTWSYATYTAAMPSWYNLIFAIFATAAMMRFVECGRRSWLFVAGLCAGLSFLIKLPGIYLLAALLLYLVFEEQTRPDPGGPVVDRRYPALLIASLLGAVAVLFATVHRVQGAAVLYHFFLPLTAVAALVVAHEPHTGRFWHRCMQVWRLWFPVLAGAAIPVALFAIVMRHALRQWLYGVFVLPQQRFYTTTTRQPPELWAALAALPLIAAVAAAVFRRSKITFFSWSIFAETLVIVLVKSTDTSAYKVGTYPIWMLPAPVVLIGCVTVWLRRSAVPADDVRRTMLVLSVLAACLLVQFPFSVIIYFCYITPLMMFAIIGILRLLPRWPHPAIAATLLGFFACHAIFLFAPAGIAFKHRIYWPDDRAVLELERAGGLEVPYWQWQYYQPAIQSLRQHARGDYTYCALDCPDVYFYSGLRNPTPILYDDFDNPRGRNERILKALEEHSVNAVMLTPSLFLGPVPRDLADALAERYPHGEKFGPMQVRWK